MNAFPYIDRPQPPSCLSRRRAKRWRANLAKQVRLNKRRTYGHHTTWIMLGQIANGRTIE